MTNLAIECHGVSKRYAHFDLSGLSLAIEEGTVTGFVGPNGAGKSTTIRILMGLVRPDAGTVNVMGCSMPDEQIEAKKHIGFLSEDMRLYKRQTIGFHMDFIERVFGSDWDASYADHLLTRFDLVREQPVKGLSHGQRVKAGLLLALARRPKLLILDEPTTGLDPVARQEVLAELMSAIEDESRTIFFSSHNTLDIEQISDRITFVDRGRVVDSRDKESFLDGWRRVHLELAEDAVIPSADSIVETKRTGHIAVLTTNDYTEGWVDIVGVSGACVKQVDRMSLEEIFLASVSASREARA